MNFFQYLHSFYGKNTIIGALYFEEKFRSEQNLCAMAENALILANHPLLWNFSFCKNPFITGVLDKKNRTAILYQNCGSYLVEVTRFELVAFWMPFKRATNCAIAPLILLYNIYLQMSKQILYYCKKCWFWKFFRWILTFFLVTISIQGW